MSRYQPLLERDQPRSERIDPSMVDSDEDCPRSERIDPSPGCPHCRRLDEGRARYRQAGVHFDKLSMSIRQLQAHMLALQVDVRGVQAEQREIVRLLKAAEGAHPHCAICHSLTGPGHPGREKLLREPHGRELVCPDCYRTLDTEHRTAPAQLRANWDADREEA